MIILKRLLRLTLKVDRPNSASVVRTPRVSETVILSRLCAADLFSSCAPIAEGNFLARASPFENTWHAVSERPTAEGNLWLLPNQQARTAVVEKTKEKTDTELVRLCNIADYVEILKIGEFLQTRPARNSAGMLSILCGEANKPISVEGGQKLRRISPAIRIGPIKKYIFKQEGSAGINVKVPSTSKPEKLMKVNACTDEVQNGRQIAAINTVTLTENANNETVEGPGKPAAAGGTLIAKGDFQQEHLPIQRSTWSVVPRSLTSQRMKEQNEVCWKEGAKVAGQQLDRQIHTNFQREELVYIRSLQGHSGKNLDTSTLPHKNIKKDTHRCCRLGFSRHEKFSKNLEDLCKEILEQAKAENNSRILQACTVNFS